MATYTPLSAEMGATQVALNLAGALAARGHEVVPWWPGAVPPEVRWWQDWLWRRRRLEEYLDTAPPFDVIDLPPLAVSRRIARHAPLVARSIQPDLTYFRVEAQASLRRAARAPLTTAAHLAHGVRLAAAVVRGWRHAAVILCLGTAEEEWMGRHLPWTRRRLAHYFNTVGRGEQEELARVREARREAAAPAGSPGSGLRFLWIGRWAEHKGTARLVRFLIERTAARPRDSFTLAGTGEAPFTALPARLLEEGRIRIVPTFSRAELSALLSQHDAGLFTSVTEGWGLTLNEMLEAGLPLFATEAGGVRDLRPFFPATLLPFPPPLDVDLADLQETGSRGYYEHFTWEAIAARYEREVLHRLCPPGA